MEKKIEVYYDGLCTMCSASMHTLKNSSKGDVFIPRDITTGELPPGVDMKSAMRNMHAIDDTGRVYAGGDALLRILEEYPRWQWLARIGKMWGIRHVLNAGYRILATHRRRFNSIVK